MLPPGYPVEEATVFLTDGRAIAIEGSNAVPISECWDFERNVPTRPFSVEKAGGMWRLTTTDDADGTELLFSTRGVIVELSLPPFTKWATRPTAKRHLIKQQVVLSGFTSTQFSTEIDVLRKMSVWLDRFFPSGTLAQWSPLVVGGHTTLEFSNRLLTPTHLVAPSECIPLGRDIDPSGALQKTVGKDLAHTEDNVVRYFNLCRTQPIDVPPTLFRPGDIVQLTFTVNIFQSKSSARLGLVLRSVTLLDSRFAMNAAFASKPPLAPAPVSIERAEHAPRTIKRPRDYRTAEDDNVDHLRKRIHTASMAPTNTRNRKRSANPVDSPSEVHQNKRSKHRNASDQDGVDHEEEVTLSTGEQTDQPDANEVDAEGSPLTVNSRSPSVNPDWRSDSGIVVTPEKGKRTALFYESTEAAATPSVVTPPSNVNPVSTSDSGPVVTPNKGHPTGLTYGPPETAATSSLITPGSIEPTKQTNIVLAVPNLVNSGHVPDRRSRYTFLDLPEDQRVLRRTLQDPLLDYSKIPTTNPATIEPWTTESQPMTRPYYSMMPKMLSDSDTYMPVLRAALEFVSYSNWVNPSRVDVNDYKAAAVDNKNSYLTRVDDPKHGIVSCIIPAIISGSTITTRIRKTSTNNNTYYFKRIYAVAFRQEYELMVGKFGMIFGFDSISGDYIPPQTGFVTRPAWPPRDSNRGKIGNKKSKLNLLRGTTTINKSTAEDEADLGLTGDDNIPVYDARYVPGFRVENYLTDMSVLPTFEGEIPLSATALIAFNPVVYHNGSSRNIKFYLLWAIVIDHSPVDDDEEN